MTSQEFDYEDPSNDDWPAKELPEDDKTALKIVFVVLLLVLLGVGWTIFIVRDSWWSSLLPLGVFAASSLLLFMRYRSEQTKLFLVILNLVHAWLVFFVRQSYTPFVVGTAFTFMLARIVLVLIRGTEAEAFTRGVDMLTKPVTPSRRARRTMTSNEEMWQEKPRHPIVFVPIGIILAPAATLTITKLADKRVGIAWTIVLFCLLVVILLWHRDRICFTNWRVFRTYGLIGRKTQEMAYPKMTDKSIIIPWHSVILAKLRIIDRPYGTLILETAGQQQALNVIHWVQNAEAVKVKISEQTQKSTE